jgi:hypothetical protein
LAEAATPSPVRFVFMKEPDPVFGHGWDAMKQQNPTFLAFKLREEGRISFGAGPDKPLIISRPDGSHETGSISQKHLITDLREYLGVQLHPDLLGVVMDFWGRNYKHPENVRPELVKLLFKFNSTSRTFVYRMPQPYIERWHHKNITDCFKIRTLVNMFFCSLPQLVLGRWSGQRRPNRQLAAHLSVVSVAVWTDAFASIL